MSAPPRGLLGVIVGAAIALGAGIVLGLPFASRAQQPAAPPPASAPAAPAAGATASTTNGYVGAEMCKGCHDEAFSKFSHTKMGRLFLKQARNPKEANACENCHTHYWYPNEKLPPLPPGDIIGRPPGQ